jgi:hypothetical protein
MTEDPVGFKVRFRICKSIRTAIPAIVQGGSNHIPVDLDLIEKWNIFGCSFCKGEAGSNHRASN